MELAPIRRIRVDPERVTAHCGRHVLSLSLEGLVEPGKNGYYFNKTRFLSRFGLRCDGKPPKSVSCDNVESHATSAYFLSPTPAGRSAAPPGDDDSSGGEIVAKGIEIQINTFVGGGFHQDVFVVNHGLAAATVPLDFVLDADFADLAEVEGGERKQNAAVKRTFSAPAPGKAELTLAYAHPQLNHATRITLAAPGLVADSGDGLRATLKLEPRATASIGIDVAPEFLGERLDPWFGIGGKPSGSEPRLARRQEWLADATQFETPSALAQTAWARAATDLYSLHALEGEGDEIFTPIGGIPKYTGLFGRDSLVTGLQSMLLTRTTLIGALRSVGAWTAKAYDNRYDAEPGKVLHQRQLGPLALLGENAFAHYYGDYSAPAYYLIGAAAHFAATGDKAAFDSIRDKVEATLAWMDRDGDIDGDGFYEYRTRAGKNGLKNQGWKDSDQAILYPDGSYVKDPIAVAEVQGLYFAAKQAVACIFAAYGESARASALLEEAAALKRRFNGRFWMPDLGFIALALDPDKNPVKTIASNPGTCLASGIVDEDKTRAVAERLMAPDMFSGWGLRTLSSDHPAFNPLSYHLGSVWPVSTAHACLGLKRYGFNDLLHRLAKGLIEATQLFDFDRLPELFGGHPRQEQWLHPGLYPGACSPQAWSTSAVIQVLSQLIGVSAIAPLKTLVVDPALPEWLPEVTLRNFRIGDQRAVIALKRQPDGATRHEIVEGAEGWKVVRVECGAGRDRFAAVLAEVFGVRLPAAVE